MVRFVLARLRHEFTILKLEVEPLFIAGLPIRTGNCQRCTFAPDDIDRTDLLKRSVLPAIFARTLQPSGRTNFHQVLVKAVEYDMMRGPALGRCGKSIEIGNLTAVGR